MWKKNKRELNYPLKTIYPIHRYLLRFEFSFFGTLKDGLEKTKIKKSVPIKKQ